MKSVSVIIIACAAGLAGCVGGSTGTGSNANVIAMDSYFALNVGRMAGRAEAIASLCPTLSYNPNALELNRVAICEAEGNGAVSCDLPRLDSEKAKTYTATLNSLSGKPAEEICASARAEAASDFSFADYFIGLQVARSAPVATPAPEAEPAASEADPAGEA